MEGRSKEIITQPEAQTPLLLGFRISRPYKNPRRPAFRGGGGYRMPAYSTDQETYSGSATVSTVPSSYSTLYTPTSTPAILSPLFMITKGV